MCFYIVHNLENSFCILLEYNCLIPGVFLSTVVTIYSGATSAYILMSPYLQPVSGWPVSASISSACVVEIVFFSLKLVMLEYNFSELLGGN